MSLTEEYNLTEYEVWNRLGESALFADEMLFEVRSVFRKKEAGQWKLWACSIEKSEVIHDVLSEEYKENAFFITYAKFKDIKSVLKCLTKDGIIINKRFPPVILETPVRWKESLIPAAHSACKKPIRHFTTSTRINDFNDEPLVGHKLPYYASFLEHVKEFIPYEKRDNKCMHLLVEDKRAWLENNNGQINLIKNIDVSVVGEIEFNEKKIKIGTGGIQEKDINIENATSVEIWVVGNDNLVFDYIASSAYPYNYELILKEKAQALYIEEKIDNGETIDCEFKKYIELEKGDSKAEEIDKTICAFSNTTGGYLIIGVSDDGEIVGVSNEVRKNYKTSLEESIRKYIAEINKRLCENLTNNECFTSNVVEVHSKYLIIITVKKVNRWNFVQHTDIPYRRRGATNFNATRLVALDCESNTLTARGFN